MEELGIVYVLHGRRNKVSTKNLAVIQQVMNHVDCVQAVGFLEGDYQPLEEALVTIQEKVEKIVIVPLLLFPASHFSEDLPQRAQACLGQKPFVITEVLGTTTALYQYLLAEFQAVLPRYGATSDFLIINHGSARFTEPQTQLTEICEKLSQELKHGVAASGYIVPGVWENELAQHHKPLVIKRLFLSDGRLARRIVTDTKALRDNYDDYFLPTLEEAPVIAAMIYERLEAYHVSYHA